MADILKLSDDRTLTILDGVRQAFADKGFDGASMQDLARAASMSAGNFYRYFPSKDAIVEAMIARDLAEMKVLFGAVLASSDPASALVDTFDRRLADLDCDEGPLWAEVDAAANRKPEIARIVLSMETEICGYLTAILGRIADRPTDEAATRYRSHALFLVMLFKASAQRLHRRGNPIPPEVCDEVRNLALATVRKTLSDVASDIAQN